MRKSPIYGQAIDKPKATPGGRSPGGEKPLCEFEAVGKVYPDGVVIDLYANPSGKRSVVDCLRDVLDLVSVVVGVLNLDDD